MSGLESLMTDFSLTGSVKKGPSMNAAKSMTSAMAGTPSSGSAMPAEAIDANDPFWFASSSSSSAAAKPKPPPSGGAGGGAGVDDIFGLGIGGGIGGGATCVPSPRTISRATPRPPRSLSFWLSTFFCSSRPTLFSSSSRRLSPLDSPMSAARPIPHQRAASGGGGMDFFSSSPARSRSPAMGFSPAAPGLANSMKKKSGMAGDAFDFANVDDLLGGGRPMSGAPMRTQSIDDLLGGAGTASGASSGPGSAVVGGGGGGGGGGAAGDDDLLGALFGETTTTTSRTASGSKLGGLGAPASTSGGGTAASSANDLLDGADDFFSGGGGVASGIASAKDSPASAGSGHDELDLSGVMDDGESPTLVEDTTGRGYDRGRSAVEDASEIEPAVPEPTPSTRTAAASADDGLAGFEDFFSPGGAAATSSGAAASGGGGGGLDSLEDLLRASTTGGGGKGKGGGMSLGSDKMDDLFGPPVHPSGGGVPAAAVIDDMFGAMMGGGRTNAAPAAASADEFSYAPDSDDEDREGDTRERKEARRRRHERVKAAIDAKLQEKRDRESRALADQAERQMLKDMIGADIDEWLRVNQNNVRTMLANLGDVLWQNHGYKSPSMNDLLNPPSVKKCYHRALILIHPDKVRQRGGDTSMIYIADKVFDQVRDAYKAFEAKEM